MFATSTPRLARNPALRACTRPLTGCSTTVTPGVAAATAAVPSVLALLTTRISASQPVASISARMAARQAGNSRSSL